MKWFEQSTTEHSSLIGKQILKTHGAAGYGAYVILKQIIGENMNENMTEWGYVPKDLSMEDLAEKCGLPIDKFRQFITFCDERFIFEQREGRLFCASLLEEKNEYAKKVQRRKNKEDKGSTDNPDNTYTKDNQVQSLVTTQPQHNTTQPQSILNNDVPADADIVQELLEEKPKGGITQEFQYLGLQIFELTKAPPEKKSECMRIAKKYPEGRVMAALSFARDYPQPNLKWKMFLWKLNELMKQKGETSEVAQVPTQ